MLESCAGYKLAQRRAQNKRPVPLQDAAQPASGRGASATCWLGGVPQYSCSGCTKTNNCLNCQNSGNDTNARCRLRRRINLHKTSEIAQLKLGRGASATFRLGGGCLKYLRSGCTKTNNRFNCQISRLEVRRNELLGASGSLA